MSETCPVWRHLLAILSSLEQPSITVLSLVLCLGALTKKQRGVFFEGAEPGGREGII